MAQGLANRGLPTGGAQKPPAESMKKDTAGFFKELIHKSNNKKVVANERKPPALGGPNSGAPVQARPSLDPSLVGNNGLVNGN